MQKEQKNTRTKDIQRLIDRDQYWGEFPEETMDKLLSVCEKGGFDAARTFIRDLKRSDFIFGYTRSDFLYYLDIDKDSVCLDCGAGLGVHTFNMAREAKEVHAFDLSLKRLSFINHRRADEKVDNIHLYHSDFAHLPFEEGVFDVIVMNGVVEWLGEIRAHRDPREDQVAVLRQMERLLKPGGRLYIGIENRWAIAYLRGYDHNGLRFTNFMPRFLANVTTKLFKGIPYRTYTYGRRGYERLLKDSGFQGNNIDVTITYPGYNLPQYIIPFDDLAAQSFFFRNIGDRSGIRGRVRKTLARFSLFPRLLRYLSWSFGIIATKERS